MVEASTIVNSNILLPYLYSSEGKTPISPNLQNEERRGGECLKDEQQQKNTNLRTTWDLLKKKNST